MRIKPPSSLLQVLSQQVIPWVLDQGIENMVVAHPSLKQMQDDSIVLPQDIAVTPKRLKSKRKPAKGRRLYGNTALVDAYWEKDGLHSIRAPKLCFILAGPVAFQVENYILRCNPGHSILIPPGLAHPDGSHTYLDDLRSHNNACDLLILMPYSGGVECWLSRTRDGQHWSHQSKHESCRILNRQVTFYFEALLNEATSSAKHSSQMCNALLVALMTLILRELEEEQRIGAHSIYAEGAPANVLDRLSPIDQAKEYIHNNLGEDLSIEIVARHVYMSRTKFTAQFRQETGRSFNKYLSDCRFEEAKVLLLDETNWPIERISGFVGIKPGRLRSLFHQRLGIAPSEFRQIHHEKHPERNGR